MSDYFSPNIVSDTDIEKNVIGQLLTYYDKLGGYLELISGEDFSNGVYRHIFDSLQAYSREGKHFDINLFGSKLGKNVKRVAADCMEAAVSSSEFPSYLARLRELSQKRRINTRLFELGNADELTVSALEELIEKEKEQAGYISSKERATSGARAFIDGLGKPKPKILTGFKEADWLTGGFRKASVVHIGARPSTGKTAFSLNIAANQPEGVKVAFFSLEMSTEMIFERLISRSERIDYASFSRQHLSDEQVEKAKQATEKILKRDSFWCFDDIYSIESIVATVTELMPDLVIIDYVQKITTSVKFITTRERIEHISGEFKRLAKKTSCTIIALSQLTRNGKEAPTMSDLKESGALEADGDYIFLLHRPYVLDKSTDKHSPGTTELIVDKNKFGGTGKIDLWFEGRYQEFRPIEKRYDNVNTTQDGDVPF